MSENSNSESNSYRKLLIFVLAFQAVLATGWIVYDNYENYLENPNQIALSSLFASITGLVIVFLVWYLLISVEKELKIQPEKINTSKNTSEELDMQSHISADMASVNDPIAVSKASESINKSLSLEQSIIWEYDLDYKSFVNIEEGEQEVPINYPESASLYDKLQNAEVLDFQKLDTDIIQEISAFKNKATLALPIQEKGALKGMVTVMRSQEATWQQEEIRDLMATKQFFANRLLTHINNKKLHLLETEEKYWDELNTHPELASAIYILNEPILTNEVTVKALENTKLHKPNKAFELHFSELNLSKLLTENNLEHFKNNGIVQFEYVANQDATSFNCLAKAIFEHARIHSITFSAVKINANISQHSVYNDLIENSEDIFITIDAEEHIQFASKSASENFGIEILNSRDGLNILSFVPDAGYDQLKTALDTAKNTGQRQYLKELPFRNKHNDIVAYDTIIYALNNHEESNNIALELRIIEERLELAHSMSQKQQLLSDLLNLSDEVLTVVNEQGQILFESENMQKHYGYNKTQRVGTYGFEYIAPQFTEQVHQDFEKVKDYPSFKSSREINFLKSDGEWENVILSQVNMLDNELVNGIVIKLAKIQNISGVPSPSEHPDLFNTVFNQTANPAIILNAKGEILHANNNLYKLLQINRNDLENHKFLDFIHDKEKSAIKNNLEYLESTPDDIISSSFHIKNNKDLWHKTEAVISTIAQDDQLKAYLISLDTTTKTDTEKESDIAFRARFYNTLLSGVNSILIFADFNGNVKYVNPVGKSLLGYQLKGNLKERLLSSDHEVLLLALKSTQQNTKAQEQVKVQIIDKEGKWQKCSLNVKNALSFSSFKGAVIELSLAKKHKELSTNAVEKTALVWLNELENTGIAFLMKNGNLLYKNQKLEELLQKQIKVGNDIQQAVKDKGHLQQLFKKALKLPGESQTASLHTIHDKQLLFGFSNINGNAKEQILVLSVKEESIKVKAQDLNTDVKDEPKQINPQSEENLVQEETELKKEVVTKPELKLEQITPVNNNIEEEKKEIIQAPSAETFTAVPEALNAFEGEPELINANEVLERSIAKNRYQFSADMAIVREFKNDTWLVCKPAFLEKIFDTVFSVLHLGNTNTEGKMMITAQKEDKTVSITMSENFSENSLNKATEGFKSGELEAGPVSDLFNYGKILEAYQGSIRIQSETDRGISINLQLPGKIGMSF